MTTKHTPGPWTCNANYGTQHYMVWDADGNYHEMRDDVASPEMDANARLIAAAPDLLAPLKELLWGASRTSDGDYSNAFTAAREAIDKATKGQ